MRKVILCIATAISIAFNAHAADVEPNPELNVLATKLAKETKVIYVGRLTGAVDSFTEDKNPETLQVVTLPKNEGSSHTSENGEIVFMKEKISAADQEKLLSQAFLSKAKIKLATLKSSQAKVESSKSK
ncbi:MAG: hypothetical protein EOO07_18085 [Chitinophagaceae bacterium]|nr:MAG: hypothetical protein EOO07_18085 [Chitinophagaceae bacterium]